MRPPPTSEQPDLPFPDLPRSLRRASPREQHGSQQWGPLATWRLALAGRSFHPAEERHFSRLECVLPEDAVLLALGSGLLFFF